MSVDRARLTEEETRMKTGHLYPLPDLEFALSVMGDEQTLGIQAVKSDGEGLALRVNLTPDQKEAIFHLMDYAKKAKRKRPVMRARE